MTNRSRSGSRAQEGFTLVELLVAMVIVLMVSAGALAAFTNALRATETMKLKLDMNDQMRIALDLMVRDFIQVGQGLPDTKVIPVPSGIGATAIRRPSPTSATYLFPLGTTVFNAVTVGDALGPVVRGVTTDIVTLMYVDGQYQDVVCRIAANGSTATVVGTPIFGVPDPIRAGDLVMLTQNASAIQMVTSNPTSQTIAFATQDAMNLNQRQAAAGTVMQINPNPAADAQLDRIRMVMYSIDATTDPALPRLVRQVNISPPRVVAFGIDNLQFTYDLNDGLTNPTSVASPATPNQIRKVNIALGVRSRRRSKQTNDFFRGTIATQVSFRSLALVDRYR